jgi:aspartate-semialdehyde dehydrogenase
MDMLKTCIVGATGVVGQQFVVALQNHPWFNISCLAASERSAGKTYLDALRHEETRALRWFCDEAPEKNVLNLKIQNAESLNLNNIDLVFSALESGAARRLESRYAEDIPVISTASAYRYEADVPILIPGINSEHISMIDEQQKRRGWRGFITTQPNCTTTGMVITLKPIFDNFGVNTVIMTSLQSLSGAGRSPGVVGLDILDNVIPFIPREEEKVETETLKILGQFTHGKLEPADLNVSCTCTRVNVLEGHTEAVFVSTKRECSITDVRRAFTDFKLESTEACLPSAPEHLIVYTDDPFRPQPRLDRNNCNGMATTVGRLRRDSALKNGVKYVLVSHNTKMGAAKGAVLIAEQLHGKGYL